MDESKKANWKKLGSSLKTIIPGIAGLLGGPAVGAGAAILTDFFGSDDPESIEAQVSEMTHDELLALKRADSDVRVAEIQAEAQIEESIQDGLTERLLSDNATDSKIVQLFRPLVGYAWTIIGILFVIGAVILACLAEIEDTRVELVKWAAITTITILTGIYGFYFTGRSKEKTAAITANRSANNPVLKTIFDLIRNRDKG